MTLGVGASYGGPTTSLLTAPGYTIAGISGDDPGNTGVGSQCYPGAGCTPYDIASDMMSGFGIVGFPPNGSMDVNPGGGFCMTGFPGFIATTFNSELGANGVLNVYGNATGYGDLDEGAPSDCSGFPNAITFRFGASQWQYVGQFAPDGTDGGYYLQSMVISLAQGMVSPTTVNFGQVLVGQTSPQQIVTLKNTGDSQLTVSSIAISGNFALPKNTCANGVKPGTHCNVYVTFTPHALETETGTLTFTDNASNNPQTVSLTGTGSSTANTKTVLTASPKSIYAGQLITFTAKVTSLGGGAIPDGEVVQFERAGVGLGSGTLLSGVASLTIALSGLSQNSEGIAAQYQGDPTFNPSKGTAAITVLRWPVSITVPSNSSEVGQPVTLTAAISSSSPIAPTGHILFSKVQGSAVIQNGVASEPYIPLPQTAGTYPLFATYKGDDYNAPGEGTGSQVINPTSTTTSIKSSSNPSVQGKPVTLIANVANPWNKRGAVGSITFTSGATTLGTVTLTNSAAHITTSSLPVGQNTITATYTPGDGNFLSSSASLVQTVQ